MDVFPFIDKKDPARGAYKTIASLVPMFPLENTDIHQGSTHEFKEFKYLPVRMIKNRGNDIMIWIINRDNSYLPTVKIQGLLITWLECLISFQSLVATGSQLNPKTRLEGYEELLCWFMIKMFSSNKSLPVVGAVRSEQLQKRFGPVQQWIIWYLYLEDPKKAHLTAIAILGIWCKTNHPEKWKNLIEINSCFWSVISVFTTKFVEKMPNLKNVNRAERSTNIPPQLGSLKMNVLKKSIRKLKLNHLIIKFRAQKTETVNKERGLSNRLPRIGVPTPKPRGPRE
ncbi:hypothetical protein PSHT_03262 [Puccinia striiformis]|uniref:Uncharacterized protein n=1 Tax=Puccinia striiformis TaxID=27350 RepID=A0A2S4WFX9_9BASI|nr:hypothetical protein PSHT_03262 [Puccinia striiformis]